MLRSFVNVPPLASDGEKPSYAEHLQEILNWHRLAPKRFEKRVAWKAGRNRQYETPCLSSPMQLRRTSRISCLRRCWHKTG